MLRASGLTVGYSTRPIISNINAELARGELTVLIGANGSGKSTLLRTLCGAQPPLAGNVEIDGSRVDKLSAEKLSRLISIVMTDRVGGGGLTVKELVSLGRHPYSGFFGKMTKEDKAIVEESINILGLSHKSDRYVSELSDGERQKAMISRALAQDTPVIIMDEPTSFLDVSSRFEIMQVLAKRVKEMNRSIILSTHDTSASLPLANCVWAVAEGCLTAGTLDELASVGVMDHIFTGVIYDTHARDFRPSI